MFRFKIEHKNCKATREVVGVDIYDAMRKNELELKFWNVLSYERLV